MKRWAKVDQQGNTVEITEADLRPVDHGGFTFREARDDEQPGEGASGGQGGRPATPPGQQGEQPGRRPDTPPGQDKPRAEPR